MPCRRWPFFNPVRRAAPGGVDRRRGASLLDVFPCMVRGYRVVSEEVYVDIEQCIDAYRRSIEKADTSLAATVWAQTPEVSLIHPRGHEHGWEAVKANFYEKVMGTLFSARQLDLHDVRVHRYPEAAVAEFYWDFTATVRSDGSTRHTQGRESQVYVKTPEGWRLVHVHYSAPAA